MKQRILAILLSLTMMFTLVPTAMAEGEEAPAGGEPTPVETSAVKTTKTGDVTYSADNEKIENLVYTSGTMTVTGANVTIENVTFGDNAALVVNTTGDFTLTNCQFAPNTAYDKDGNAGVRTAVYLKIGGTATVTNNTFEGVDNGYYNAIEFGIGDDPSLKNATISGNTFTKTIKNNYFNFYNMQEGAVIDITNNQFLLANKSSNGIRISNNKNVSATFNLGSNTYTYAATSADSMYEGLILLQDYAGQNAVQDFKKIVINITNLTAPEDAKQILYVYDDQDGIIQTNQPVVKGDSSIEKFFVAKVDDTYYKTLAEAVAAAQSGETVKLLHDIDFGTDRLMIKKAITLDLAGHKITTNNSVCTLYFTKTATVTDSVGNGKIENTYGTANGIGIVSGGEDADLTLNGVTVSGYYGVFIQQGANVTVINSNIKAIFCGIAVLGQNDSNKKNTSVIVKSGTVEGGDYAIAGNGAMQGTEITITGGTIRETGNNGGGAIYHPQNGTLSISGDALIEGESGIQLCSGEGVIANITGGVIRATGNDQRASKTGDGFIPDGAALSIVNRDYPGGTPKMNVSGGYFAAEKNNAVLAYTWSANKASEWTNAKEYLSINGGLFSSDPSDYVAAGHYVDASNNGDYPYTVKEGAKPAGALIVVKDKTDTAVNGDITGDDKTAINNVISKANVDGVAEAVTPAKKADIVSKSNTNPGDNDKVEIEVAVKVEAKAADLANGKLTFEASPVATVKVNGAATGTTVPVTNDMLNGQPITVKLPLPTVDGKLFTPEQIKHISSDGSVEYFLKTAKRGANTFEIKDGCAVFTITKFSTFELSGTVTYVEPSYYSGSSSDPTYSVTVDKTENGSVTVSPKSASKGDTVTVTVKPDSGYVLETLTVTDKNGNELTLKDKGDGKYTFTMPAGKVEVKATFMEDNSVLNFFYDVPNDAFFYEAVKWAVKSGVTNGLSDTMFGPYESCTRAQIVTFLWRAAGSPEPKTASSFTDVPANAYYAKAVAWAVENGITNGMTATMFAPDETCTRGQSVTFLYRALKGTASGSANFTDVKSDAFYADAINWAVANNVTNGTSNTTFSPNADCTRAEIVTFLYRAYQGK